MALHGNVHSGLGRYKVLSHFEYTVTATGTNTFTAGVCDAVAVWAKHDTSDAAANSNTAFLKVGATAVTQEGFVIKTTRDEPLVIPVDANANEIRCIGTASDVLSGALLALKE